MAAQIFYPDEYNCSWAACPDPVDFRAYTVVNIYEHENAYYADSPWKRMPRPGNAISRLRYHQFFAPKIVERIEKSAPLGADSKSWRY